MKVLIVGPAWPLRGGLATFDERLCESFLNEGHDCEILSFSLQYPSFLFPGKTQYSSDPPPKSIKIFTKLNSVNPFNWLIQGVIFKKKKYDLVVFRYWMPFMGPCLGTIARLLKQNKSTRIVAITDNLIPHEKRPGDGVFTRYFIKACDGLLAMSDSVLQDVKAHFPNKPVVYSPHPMYDMFLPKVDRNEAYKKLGLDNRNHYILFFGFIRKYKGLDLLIQAMAEPALKNLPVKAIIAGEFYEDALPYLQQIESLNVKDRFVLATDFIPNSQVHWYFSAAEIVVQPYHSATQSGVTQIAYYYDVPMIVTDTGGLAELVPNGVSGFVVDKTPADIAKHIAVFFNENLNDKMVEGVMQQKLRFTWTSLIHALKKVSNG